LGPNPQSPIPNPQSPIPKKVSVFSYLFILLKNNKIYIIKIKKKWMTIEK